MSHSFRLISIVMMIGLAACKPSAMAQNQTKKTIVGNMYSLELPESLADQGEHFDNNAIRYGNVSEVLFLELVPVPLADLDTTRGLHQLPVYFPGFLRSFSQTYDPPLEVGVTRTLMIGPLPALATTMVGSFRGQELYFEVAVIQSPDHFFQYFSWTDEAHKSENYKDMRKILSSFRLVSD